MEKEDSVESYDRRFLLFGRFRGKEDGSVFFNGSFDWRNASAGLRGEGALKGEGGVNGVTRG